jgi:manganese transport protein
MNSETAKVSTRRAGWFQRLLAFVGPAYLVSVGYMDPGNWATDIEGGARFGYALIWVLLLSNLMAILLQTLSARLGIVTGHDLAQGCRREYPRVVRLVLWVLAEIAIAATDLAEALGTIVGLQLLFHIPLLWGCAITACDTVLFLLLQRFGVRKLEAFIIMLVATIGGCFLIEVFLARPDWSDVVTGFEPRLNDSSLYIAIGIIGATVMPHNLYLHSSLVQSRSVSNTATGKREACGFNLIDSVVALNGAFFINAAILIVAAAAFYVRGIEVTELGQAHALLDNVLGSTLAPAVFAVALLAAGQSSTITGTISGQIIMEGFLNLRMKPWLRRLVTRMFALAPAVIAIAIAGEQGVYKLLILSQVVLSLQLPFAIVPLIQFTSDAKKMGRFANPKWVKTLAWCVAVLIIILNVLLIYNQFGDWLATGGIGLQWLALPPIAFLAGILFYLIAKPWFAAGPAWETTAISVSREVASRIRPMKIHRVGAALEHADSDSSILSAAVALAKANRARLYLIHVVDAPGVAMLGRQSGSLHADADELYLEELAREVENPELSVEPVLLFGKPFDQLVRIAEEMRFDLLILGSHGHRGIEDLLHGQTVSAVRHRLTIPILVVHSAQTEPALHLPGKVSPATPKSL